MTCHVISGATCQSFSIKQDFSVTVVEKKRTRDDVKVRASILSSQHISSSLSYVIPAAIHTVLQFWAILLDVSCVTTLIACSSFLIYVVIVVVVVGIDSTIRGSMTIPLAFSTLGCTLPSVMVIALGAQSLPLVVILSLCIINAPKMTHKKEPPLVDVLKQSPKEDPTPLDLPLHNVEQESMSLDVFNLHPTTFSSSRGSNTRSATTYALRSLGPIKEEIVMVKKPYSLVKVTNFVPRLRAQKEEVKCSGSGKKKLLSLLLNINDAEISGKIHCPFSTRIKRKHGKKTNEGLRKKVKPGMVDDEPIVRKSIKTSLKGKEKMYELFGTPSKGSWVVVTNYKRAIVNGKAKMVEDVGLIQKKVDVGIKLDVRRRTNMHGLLASSKLQKQPVVSATKV
uniref:Uncharacterized protein n=1 Tax=Tanacetum cinerariifolium TaxID=118510 RepID=A0A6L2MGP9_TANCI|nr:hypothetical protein [Tanacetum cinerariifolium]